MSTISHIKHVVRTVQPVLEEVTQATMNCLEELRACGIFTEEMQDLANAIECLENTHSNLNDRLIAFREYEDLNEDD
jgi:hypothetical protein